MEHVNPPRTLFDKLWKRHVVTETVDGPSLLYVDRHLVYEVTSPQAFEALRSSGRKAWRPETVLAAADHNAVESQRTSMQTYNCSLKSSFIELPAGGARIKPAFPLFQAANGVQIYQGRQCILLQAWRPASPSIHYT